MKISLTGRGRNLYHYIVFFMHRQLDYDTMVNNKWIKLSFKMHKMGDYCPEKWIKVRG